MRYLVYLDSRNSLGPRPSLCQFNLNQQIVNAKEVRVVSFVFANTFYNVNETNNRIVFDSFTLVVPPGFYTTAQLFNSITGSSVELHLSSIRGNRKGLKRGERKRVIL